eukprot:807072-Amphidinium_carterae.1
MSPVFRSLGTRLPRTAVIALETAPAATRFRACTVDRKLSGVSSKTNWYTTGLTSISPIPVKTWKET